MDLGSRQVVDGETVRSGFLLSGAGSGMMQVSRNKSWVVWRAEQ
jgi:hypothetical protein